MLANPSYLNRVIHALQAEDEICMKIMEYFM